MASTTIIDPNSRSFPSIAAAATSMFSSISDPANSTTDAVYAGAAATDEVNPSLLPSPSPSSKLYIINHASGDRDTGLHDFLVYFAVIMGCVFVGCVYIVGRSYFKTRRASQNNGTDNSDEEKQASSASTSTSPEVPLPLPLTRSELHWLERQQPAYVSQSDMIFGRGRGFFG